MKKKELCFGYRCLMLPIIEALDATRDRDNKKLDILDQIIDSYPSGEFSYYDSISYKESLSFFSGNNISSILELASEISYGYFTLENINKFIFKNDEIDYNFKRVLFYSLFQLYMKKEYEAYKILKRAVTNLLK